MLMEPLDRHGTTNCSRRGMAVTDAKKRLGRGKATRGGIGGVMKAVWAGRRRRRRRSINRVLQAMVLVSASLVLVTGVGNLGLSCCVWASLRIAERQCKEKCRIVVFARIGRTVVKSYRGRCGNVFVGWASGEDVRVRGSQ
jgi:hypothetical protein